MLSKKQLQILGIEATRAFDTQAKNDLLDLPAEVASCGVSARRDFWRSRVCAEVTGMCSFKELTQEQYRPLLAHFQVLSGNSGAAFDSAHRSAQGAACHEAPGCEYVRDMHQWLAKAGYKPGYAAAISKARFKTARMEDLSERQLKQLHDTVVNRCRAKLGLGEAANRNKKQRESRQQSPPPAEPRQPSRERTYILRKPDQPF